MVTVSLLTVIVPLPNGLDKLLFLTTFPSGMILQVGTNSVPQVAAFEASRHPKGVGRACAAGKMLYNSKKNCFDACLVHWRFLDNISLVPIVFQNFPKYPPFRRCFFHPPSGLLRPAIWGPPTHQGICKTIGVDTILEKLATFQAHTKTRK